MTYFDVYSIVWRLENVKEAIELILSKDGEIGEDMLRAFTALNDECAKYQATFNRIAQKHP